MSASHESIAPPRGPVAARTAARALALLAVFALVALSPAGTGCASHRAGPQDRVTLAPSGPGTVFPNVESAALDALAWSHRKSLERGMGGRTQGGTIRAVEDGFTYGEPEMATLADPATVRYDLGPEDVAHFRMNARSPDDRRNVHREHVTRSDERTVDEHDPLHRPLYILTPKLRVRAYFGENAGEQEVAQLRTRRRTADRETIYLVQVY